MRQALLLLPLLQKQILISNCGIAVKIRNRSAWVVNGEIDIFTLCSSTLFNYYDYNVKIK